MRLKHLEQGIHLPHTSKYHPDAIDIYSAIEKSAGVDRLHHVRRRWKGTEGRKEGMKREMKAGKDGRKVVGESEKAHVQILWSNQSKTQDKTDISGLYKCLGILVLFEVRSDLDWAVCSGG